MHATYISGSYVHEYTTFDHSNKHPNCTSVLLMVSYIFIIMNGMHDNMVSV